MSDDNPINQARLAGAARGLPPEGLTTVTWCGFALACGFVLLRLYVRITESRRLFSDDYWLLAALFLLAMQAILQTLQNPSLYYLIYASAGEVPAGKALLDQGNVYVRYQFVIIVLFWTVTWSVKYSFLALYHRLFKGLAIYRNLWWAVVVFAALAYVGCWIASVWTCHPPSTYFDFGQCVKPIDIEGSTISITYSTAVDVLTDLIIMALPIRLLSFLHVSRAQRLALICIFSVGCIVIACALVRLTQIIAHARSDPVGLAVWGVVESSMSVIVGTLPALKSFFGRAWDRTLKRYSGQIGSSNVTWSGRAGAPCRVTVSDPEKSWASTQAIPLRRTQSDGADWQPSDQHPNERDCYDRIDFGGLRVSRNNSSSTTGLAATTEQSHDRTPQG